MEEEPQFRSFVHWSLREELFHTEWTPHYAWFRPSACHNAGTAGRSVLFASRQRVSTKIRTEPPAVRTYSIFPLDNQL